MDTLTGHLRAKANASRFFIEAALKRAARPCVLWSGGKDSTVLLHLARTARPDIECVFWTLPWQRRKLAFAHRLQEEWNLTVHDAPPLAAALCQGNGRIDVMEDYGLKGANQRLTVARGTEPMEAGQPYVCGVDWLERPKAQAAFPFDLALHGHKSVDVDPLSGPVPLQVDTMQFPGGTETVFPLRYWTDADVWTYTQAHGIPWDAARYDGQGNSLPHKGGNSDYFHACFACCTGGPETFVNCPKRGGAQINSIADRVPWVAPRHDYIQLRNQ